MSLLSLFCLFLAPLVQGHGNMNHPPAWWDRGHHFAHGGVGCETLDLPNNTEFSNFHNGRAHDCEQYWYTSETYIPGEATLPEEMQQNYLTCKGQNGVDDIDHKHPWYAPGTAPIASPCGTLGGWPYGCNFDGTGNFGDCCPGANCGGFALGKNAEEYDWPGKIPVTEWLAGSQQEVQWSVFANHAGGYSYRLCKMPHGGIKQLTEECFQEMPLKFAGEHQWVIYNEDHSHHRNEILANRTSEGTFPPGSMWTANPLLPPNEEGGSNGRGRGDVIDYIEVPSDLEPGEYVLSFRWDCKCTRQVWAACSNILIL